jgi:helicase
MEKPLPLPMFVDSGGFASLFENSRVYEFGGVGVLEIQAEERSESVDPQTVLELQEQVADVAFTLDFPIPPNVGEAEARQRQRLTIQNALWAIANRRRRDLPLYACIQGWDLESYVDCARSFLDQEFDGIAIGGLVPRMRDEAFVLKTISSVRELFPEFPIHVFGLGQPSLTTKLFEHGADSIDSSAYVKLAADGRLWGPGARAVRIDSPMTRLHLALCNLAVATHQSLPLGFAGIRFETSQLRDNHA